MTFLWSRLSNFKIEILKLLISLFSLFTLISISHVSNQAMTSFVVVQAIIVLLSSLLDYGMNVSNMSVELKSYHFQYLKVNKIRFSIVVGISLAALIYFYNEILPFYYFPFVILGAISNAYLMRSITVYRRSDGALKSILMFEFPLVFLRMLSFLILIVFGQNVFLLYLCISPLIAAILVSSQNKIENIKIFKVLDTTSKCSQNSEKFLLISVVVSFKNQALSLLIPIVSNINQGLIIIVSRLNSILIMLCSGIMVRMPMAIKLYRSDNNRKKIAIYYGSVLILFILASLLFPFYIGLVSGFFDKNYQVNFFSLEFVVVTVVFLSLLQSCNQIIFQSLGKEKLSVITEVLYFSILYFFISKV